MDFRSSVVVPFNRHQRYSCGMSWINWVHGYKSQNDKSIQSYIHEDDDDYYAARWLPMYVYEIKTDNLNIKRITNCSELFEFCEKI